MTCADSTKVMLLAVFCFYVFYHKSSITCSVTRKYSSTCRYTHFTNNNVMRYTKHISLTVLYETFMNTYYDNCVLFQLNKEED